MNNPTAPLAGLKRAMVENNKTRKRRLSEAQHGEIRRLRLNGLTMPAIARQLGVTLGAVRYRIHRYGLNAPGEEVELVRLELLTAFRETNRRLGLPDLTGAEHASLCALQVRQATALLKASGENQDLKEETMGHDYRAERERLDNMKTEELRNEIRRLAGLELKALEPPSGGEFVRRHDGVSERQSVSDGGNGSPAPTDKP